MNVKFLAVVRASLRDELIAQLLRFFALHELLQLRLIIVGLFRLGELRQDEPRHDVAGHGKASVQIAGSHNGLHNIAEDARAAAAAALILAVSEQQMLAERETLRHGGKALFADELRADARQIAFELFGESPVQILRRHEADNGIPKEFQPLIAAQRVLIDLVCTGSVGQRHAQKLRIAELVAQRLFQLIQHVLPPWAGSSARYWHEFPRRSRSRPRGWPAGSRRGWRRRRTSRAP